MSDNLLKQEMKRLLEEVLRVIAHAERETAGPDLDVIAYTSELAEVRWNVQQLLERLDREEEDQPEKVRSAPADFDRQIAGGLRDAINAHGPITPPFIASATKRVAHAIRDELKRERDRIMNSTPRQP